jgi:hypothetical protein
VVDVFAAMAHAETHLEPHNQLTQSETIKLDGTTAENSKMIVDDFRNL